MKNWKSSAFAALILASFGCSNELKLAAPWKDIPVVYGFIDRQDSAHYVRVEKAFLDAETSAITIAKIPDSIYYDNVSVYFERKNGQRFQLNRVDGALEGYPRDTGLFAQTPNTLYKIKRSAINLQAGEDLKIVIERGDNLPLDTAVTKVLGDISLQSPNLASTSGISIKPDESFSMRFDIKKEAIFFDIEATIHINEQLLNDPFTTKKVTVKWPIIRGESRRNPTDDDINKSYSSNGFYNALNAALTPANGLVQRSIFAIDFRIDSGGQEIKDYNDLLKANSGLAGAELIPVYTNMSEGFGLFTSRSFTIIEGFRINQATRDWLRTTEATKALGFIQ